MILQASLPLGFNGLEVGCVVMVILGLLLITPWLGWTRRDSVIVFVLVVPVLLLAAAEATQFMTMDEWGISDQIRDRTQFGIRQISLNAFLTGILVALPITRLLDWLGCGPTDIRMALKAAWWLMGSAVTVAVSIALLRPLDRRERIEPAAFAVVFAALFLLPTAQLALKTVNYDLLSSGLGALSMLLLLRMVSGADSSSGWLAVVVATLAAQEKLVAGPVLVAAVIVVGIASARAEAGTWPRIRRAVTSAALAICLSVSITIASLAAYRLLGAGNALPSLGPLALGPISSWSWIPLGRVLPIDVILLWRGWIGLASLLSLLGAVALAATAMPVLDSIRHRLSRVPNRILLLLAAALAAGLFVTGTAAVLLIQAYWAPFHPSPIARLGIMQQLNGVALHVGDATYGEHLFRLTLYAIGVLVIAVPSPLWAIGLLMLGLHVRHRSSSDRRSLMIGKLLLAASLVVPAGAALAGIPFAHRYFNLSLYLLACGLVSFALGPTVQDGLSGRGLAIPAASLFIVLCCAETAPFRPLFAAFRPFWLTYADAAQAEPGRLNASWMGWGEEIMPAGKAMEEACRLHRPVFANIACSTVTLYVMHPGLWLPGPALIGLESYAQVAAAPPLDRRSFYIVNRLYLIQKKFPIPPIAPDFTVAYRGYALAWVYRGDRLAAVNYKFQ